MVRTPITLLLPLAIVAALAGCDRPPRTAAGPAAATVPASAATSAGATVALSGAIADLPAGTTPDAVAPAGSSKVRAGSAVTSMPPPRRSAPSRSAAPSTASTARVPAPAATGETAAMREFREAQERRDRELLENDLDEVRQGSATDRAQTVDERPPQDYLGDEGAPVGEVEEALSDEGFEEPPLDDGFDEPPLDEGLDESPFDEPPLDEALPEDELPPEDDELQWDPATGTWR